MAAIKIVVNCPATHNTINMHGADRAHTAAAAAAATVDSVSTENQLAIDVDEDCGIIYKAKNGTANTENVTRIVRYSTFKALKC